LRLAVDPERMANEMGGDREQERIVLGVYSVRLNITIVYIKATSEPWTEVRRVVI
jgi:hypothetical protein